MKISFCTAIYNWREPFCEVLPRNIEVCKGIAIPELELELCIIDYSSTDGVGDWVQEHYGSELGHLINWYRNDGGLDGGWDYQDYYMTRGKNLAHRAASGDFVINFDGDNYLHSADYLQKLYATVSQNPDRIVLTHGRAKLRGRVGFWKRDFEALGGYNEEMKGCRHGADDRDIYMRAFYAGYRPVDLWKGYLTKLPNSMPRARHLDRFNRVLAFESWNSRKIVANEGKRWGSGKLVRNFREEIEI